MSKFIAKFESPYGKPKTVVRVSGQSLSDSAARRHPQPKVDELDRDLTDEEVIKMRAIHAPAGFKPSAPSLD